MWKVDFDNQLEGKENLGYFGFYNNFEVQIHYYRKVVAVVDDVGVEEAFHNIH